MKRAMLDLETLGTRPGCVILQIGAVEFCEVSGTLGREFYSSIDLKSCVQLGLTLDPDTILWWLAREDAARESLTSGVKESIASALCGFRDYMARVSDGRLNKHGRLDIELWGNGSSFDCAILRAAYDKHGLQPTIEPFVDRCYRTLKGLFPDVPAPSFEGVKHHALDDAKHQARHAIALLNRAAMGKVIIHDGGAVVPAESGEQNRRCGDAAASCVEAAS